MKTRISKILGLVLAAGIVASMVLAAFPVAADTLAWDTKTLPSGTGQKINTNKIVDLVVAPNGTTMYAATGAAGARLYKSTNSGTSWSAVTAASALNVTKVAVAPDSADGSVFAIIVGAAGDVRVSTNGGSTLTSLVYPVAGDLLGSVVITPTVSGARNIIVAGTNAGATAAQARYFNLGAPVPLWVDMVTATAAADWGLPAASGMTVSLVVRAMAVSPAYVSDRTVVFVTEVANQLQLETANFSSKKFNALGGYGAATGVAAVLAGTSPFLATDLALSDTYLGSDETARVAFVAAASTLGGTASDGVFRITNTSVKKMSTDTSMASVAYNGAASKLVAGAYLSNVVYRTTDPFASSPSMSASTARKRVGLDGGTVTETQGVLVRWSGTTVVAYGGSTTAVMGAFATSTDDGKTFKDVSFINVALTNVDDIAINADGSKYYLVTDDTTNTSVWLYDGTFNRVLSIAGVGFRVKVAASDFNVVFVFQQATATPFYALSANGGAASWTVRSNTPFTVQDAAVETSVIIYLMNATGGVAKSTDGGFIWGSTVASGLAQTYQLRLLSAGNVLVSGLNTAAGTDANVAYSTDSAATWTKLSATATISATGNVVADASGLASGGFIYLASSAATDNIYRWTIGTSTAWSDIFTGNTGAYQASDVHLANGVAYVAAFDPLVGSIVYRNQTPSTATSSSAWDSFAQAGVAVQFARAPETMEVSVTTAGNEVLAVNAAAAAIYTFTDTLGGVKVVVSGPADKFTAPTNPQNGVVLDVPVTWNRISVATAYSLQVGLDSAFNQVIATIAVASTSANVFQLVGPNIGNAPLQPATTYYWRIRATAPVTSAYSDTRSFTTQPVVPAVTVVTLQSPAAGATVSIRPTFQWTAIVGANYTLQVAENAAFLQPVITANALATNVYAATDALKNSTTYYWRVSATIGTTTGPFVTGVFTTEAAPAPTTTVAPTTPPPTQPPVIIEQVSIVPLWIYVLIAIGAILVIAVIVLIVRTRRV